MGGVIFIATISLSNLFRYHKPRNVKCFRKCEYIRNCYLPISSNLLKKVL